MKKIFFFLVLLFFTTHLQAKSVFNEVMSFEMARAVKIGRFQSYASGASSGVQSAGLSNVEYSKQCQSSCLTCDENLGQCSLCDTGYYLSGIQCLSCPAQYYCDGLDQIPNCEGVYCINATPTANDTGCCCVSYCDGVTCASGFSAKATANGCCCE